MEKRPPIFSLLLFLEEFILWRPGEVQTLAERLLQLTLRTAGEDYGQWVTLVNPALALLLFLIAVGPTVSYARNLITNSVGTNLILWMNRHSVIRIALAALIGLWLLRQLLITLSGDVGTLMDLYQDKGFWTTLLIGITAYKFVSPSNSD